MRLFSPLAAPYGALMSLRAAAYARKVFSSWRPPCPCISVGNIRWGGTGKTPVCAWLTLWAASSNLRPVILTRGYRARPPRLPFLVEPDAVPHEAGDEPLLLARINPACKVVVDPKRTRSGKWAWGMWQPDLFVLDDGFQHMAVKRDLNLVLLTLRDLNEDWDRVMPSGPWREGSRALSRADAFLIKLTDLDTQGPAIAGLLTTRLGGHGKPVFLLTPDPLGLTNIRTAEQRGGLPEQAHGRYALFSGVADPLSVEHTASNLLGGSPVRFDAFADHHPFSAEDIARITQRAQACNAGHVICTAKDVVKIRSLLPPDTPLQWWQLDMSVRFTPFGQNTLDFEQWLTERFNQVRAELPTPRPAQRLALAGRSSTIAPVHSTAPCA